MSVDSIIDPTPDGSDGVPDPRRRPVELVTPFVRTGPQLARGIVWSELLAEIERDWQRKQAARAAAAAAMHPLVRTDPDVGTAPDADGRAA